MALRVLEVDTQRMREYIQAYIELFGIAGFVKRVNSRVGTAPLVARVKSFMKRWHAEGMVITVRR